MDKENDQVYELCTVEFEHTRIKHVNNPQFNGTWGLSTLLPTLKDLELQITIGNGSVWTELNRKTTI